MSDIKSDCFLGVREFKGLRYVKKVLYLHNASTFEKESVDNSDLWEVNTVIHPKIVVQLFFKH